LNKIAVDVRNILKDPDLKNKTNVKVGVGINSLSADAFRIKKLSKNTDKQEDNVIQSTDEVFNSEVSSVKREIDIATERYEGKTKSKLRDLYKEYFDLIMLSPFKETGTGIYRLPYQSEVIATSSIMSLGNEMGNLFEGTRAKIKPEKLIYTEGPEIEPGAKADKIVQNVIKTGKPDPKKPLVDIDKLEFQSVSDNHVMAAREFRRILEDHPYIAEDFDAFWNRFSLEARGVVKDVKDMDLNDMMAFNDYINSVKKKGFQNEFKKKYWLQDPRTNDKELVVGGIYDVYETYANPVPKKGGTSVQKKIRVALSPIGSMKEFQAKINREENATADRIAKVLDDKFKFRTNLDKEDQKVLMDLLINKREVARGQEESILGRKDVVSFLKKKIGKQTGADLVKEYDAKLTDYYETFGKEWIYAVDKAGKRVEWNRIDKDNNYGVINRYIKYDKSGRFDIDHFLNQVITGTDYKVKTPNKGVGLDGLLRYQYEQRLEDIVLQKNPKDPKRFREAYRSNPKTSFKSGIGYINPETYFSHINFGYNKKARAEYEKSINALAEKNAQEATAKGQDPEKARNATLAFYGLVRDASMSSTGHFERAYLDSIIRNEEAGRIGFNKMPSTAKERTADLKGFDRRMSTLDKTQSSSFVLTIEM